MTLKKKSTNQDGLQADLAYLQLALPDLKNYVQSRELYGALPYERHHSIPPLTIGNVLLAMRRIEGWADLETCIPLKKEIEIVKEPNFTIWRRKVAREFSSRLAALSVWLEQEPEVRQQGYTDFLHNRAVLTLLQQEIEASKLAEFDQLQALDQRIQTLLEPAGFQWETEIEKAFPIETFWFLYRKMSEARA
jgi:hypothetical protein